MSLHIEFHYLNGSRAFTAWSTHPHLHIISSRGGEVFNKPWRGVEGTAGVSRTTPLYRSEGCRNTTEVIHCGQEQPLHFLHFWSKQQVRVITSVCTLQLAGVANLHKPSSSIPSFVGNDYFCDTHCIVVVQHLNLCTSDS